jgi:phospholipase C
MRSILLALSLLLAVGAANAKDLPAAEAAAIKAAGIPIYEQAVFLDGSREAGYRFATSQPPAAVKQWYRGKLADWVLFDQYGAWVLHKERKGAPLPEIIGKRQVSVATNPDMVGMYKISKDMTTEIVIVAPK